MAEVRWILLAPDGTPLGDLNSATARKLDYALDGPATAAFTLPGDHPDAQAVTELACDLLVIRNGQKLFRGRVGSSADQLTANAHTANFTALDYRGMLDRRILWSDSPLSFRQVDQGMIAWAMIADTQGRTGGDFGIVQGTGLGTGVFRDRDYEPGKKIGEAVTQLGEVIDGFDWEIDANLAFNVFYPYRGRATSIDLVYGSQISGVTRNVTSTSYATALRYSGDPSLQPAEVADTTFGPPGRWEAQLGNPDLKVQTSVNDAAAATLAASDQIVAGYHVDLLEGWWQPANLWLGDSAALFIDQGRLNVTGDTLRVAGISITYGDAGGEAVSVSLGDLPPSMTGRLGDYQSRIEVLERAVTAPQGYVLDAPVGAMYTWPGSSVPQTWAWADGSPYSTTVYPELFAVIGYTFGGSGTTFNVPDVRSRVVVGAGTGPGLSGRPLAGAGGAEQVALTRAQNAAHGHNIGGTTDFGNADHFHTATTSTDSNTHTHAGTTAGQNADHTHAGTTSTNSVGHTHGGVPTFIGAGADGTIRAVWTGNTTNTSDVSQPHTHGITTGPQSGPHTHTVTTGNESAEHTHSMSSTGQSQPHAHNLPAATGADGAGTFHENMPPFIALGQIIRVLPPWRPTP